MHPGLPHRTRRSRNETFGSSPVQTPALASRARASMKTRRNSCSSSSLTASMRSRSRGMSRNNARRARSEQPCDVSTIGESPPDRRGQTIRVSSAKSVSATSLWRFVKLKEPHRLLGIIKRHHCPSRGSTSDTTNRHRATLEGNVDSIKDSRLRDGKKRPMSRLTRSRDYSHSV